MTIIRLVIIYVTSTWHTFQEVKSHRKEIKTKLQKIQKKCLRTITSAYKAISTEVLEIETFISLLDLYTERLVIKTIVRIRTTKTATDIKKMYKRICRQTTNKRGRIVIPRSSPANRTNTWTDQFTSEPQEAQQTNRDKPPWEKDQGQHYNKRLSSLYKGLTSYYNKRWKDRWKSDKKSVYSRNLWSHSTECTMEVHIELKKHENVLLT